MIVLVGESASGKSTVQDALVDCFGYEKAVTCTTRPKREGEIDGVQYHFCSIGQFNELRQSNAFAETAEYNNWCYGSLVSDYSGDDTDKKVIVLTPSGLRKAKKRVKNLTSFYINVPRRDRAIKALQRGDNIDEVFRRNVSDCGQFDGILAEIDHEIANEMYVLSAYEIAEIINEIMIKKEEET